MELLILLALVFFAFVAVAPEAVMQIFLATCWLVMCCFIVYEFGRLAFRAVTG